jgi:hypothetical protein
VYGAVPPVTVRSTAPVASPKQRTAVVVVEPASAAAGWVTIPDDVVVQPLASVIVTLYVPATTFVRS